MKTVTMKNTLNLFKNITLASMKGRNAYLTKMVLASLISAFALVGNSQEGVIGSMLVSPLGGPVMALVSALLTYNFDSALMASVYLVSGFAIMIGVGMVVGKHFENQEPTHEMERRYTHPDKYTMISALVIGLCFGLVAMSDGSWVGEGVGAGIAISLLPPAVNFGVTYMNKNMKWEDKKEKLRSTLMISVYNIIGIAISCVILFGLKGDNFVYAF